MEIVFSRALTDLDGQPIVPAEGETFTLARACVEALLGEFQDDKAAGGKDKLRRYRLAMAIYEAGDKPLQVESEDIAFIKERIGKGYGALIVGRAWAILEGEDA